MIEKIRLFILVFCLESYEVWTPERKISDSVFAINSNEGKDYDMIEIINYQNNLNIDGETMLFNDFSINNSEYIAIDVNVRKN